MKNSIKEWKQEQLLSKLFQQWTKTGFMEKAEKRKDWKVKQKPKLSEVSIKNLFDYIDKKPEEKNSGLKFV